MNVNAERGKKLVGGKAIADFMGVTERTVQRWCRDRAAAGAPILKIGGRYAAFEADLRGWAEGRAA
jgi:predicted DNA-binding transcriptional regulator YafY